MMRFDAVVERALQGTMTENPQTAHRFLSLLSEQLMPMTAQDFNKMNIVKDKITGNKSVLHPWDVSYCTNLARQYRLVPHSL